MKKEIMEILNREANHAETNRKFHLEHGDKYNLAYYFLAQKDLLRRLKREVGKLNFR